MLRTRLHRRAILAAAVYGVGLGCGLAAGQSFPVTQIVIKGQETPEEGVTFDVFQTSPMFSTNARGDLVFASTLAGSGVVTSGTDANHQGVYIYDATTGQIVKSVRRGDPVTDFEIELGRYGSSTTTAISGLVGSSSVNIDDLGTGVYKVTMRGLDLPVTADTAYYIATASGAVPVMREGSELPASAIVGDMDPTWRFGDPNFNGVVNNGRLTFYAPVVDAFGAAAGTGLFSGANATDVTTIAFADVTNGTLIGEGDEADRITAISTTGTWRVNSSGTTIFAATLNGNTAALIKGSSPSNLKILAKGGEGSPIGGGVNYAATTSAFFPSSFPGSSPRSVAGDYTAFAATLAGTGVVTTGKDKNNMAMFLADATDVPKTLVRENDLPASQPTEIVTGSTQMRFAGLGDLKLSPSGWALFGAQLRGDQATSTSSRHDGIYMGRINPIDGMPQLLKVALESDADSFSQAGLHFERGTSNWVLDRWNNLSAGEAFINGDGQIVFFGDAATGTSSQLTGIFYYDPAVGRVFPLAVEGLNILLDTDGPGSAAPVNGTITSISTSVSNAEGGSGDGGRTLFNNNKQVFFQADLADGKDGVFSTDADAYLPASSHVWTATESGDWNSAGNWRGGVPDGQTAYADIRGTGETPLTVTLDGPKTIGELFLKRPGTVTITGGSLVMEGVGDRGYIGVAQGDHEIASGLVLNDTTSIIVEDDVAPETPARRLLISGVVSGTGDLRKGGAGVLKLSNANSYTGNTVIAAGYLEFDNSNQLGSPSSKVVLDGGYLRYLTPMTDDRDFVLTSAVYANSSTPGTLRGGIDIGANDVTLTGNMEYETRTSSTTVYNGYMHKLGAGTLTLALTGGGPGGVNVTEGAVEVTTPQTWGNGYTIVGSGGRFAVTSTGAITGDGALWLFSGSAPTILDGPVNIAGILYAGGNDDLDTQVDINAPSSFGSMTVYVDSTPADAVGSVINVNANTTVAGEVNIVGWSDTSPASYNKKADVNVAAGVTLTAGSFDVDGILNVPATASIVQAGTADADRISIGSSGILNLQGSMSIAGDLEIAGLLNKPANYPITIGDDLILPTPAAPVIFDAATVVGDQVRLSNKFNFTLTSAGSLTAGNVSIDANDATTGGTATFDGPVTIAGDVNVGRGKIVVEFNAPTTIGGVIAYDVISNGGASVTFADAESSSAGIDLYTSTASSANTQSVTMTIAAGATHTTGNVTLRSARTSTSGTSVFAPTVALTVAGSMDAGHLLLRASENLADRNNAKTNVDVSGTLAVKSIRHDGYRNGALQPVPDIDIESVAISGLLEIKRSDLPGGSVNDGTSILLNLPTFTGTGQLDLNNNALLLKNANNASPASVAAKLSAAQAAITSGFNGGAWDGPGFVSGAVSDDPQDLFRNLIAFQYGASGLTDMTFRGQPVLVNDIVVLPELFGDADYSGRVDAADYFRLDRGFLMGLSGWLNGDSDGDGVDGDDYFITDRTFQLQGLSLPAAVGASSVPEPATSLLFGVGSVSVLLRRRRATRVIPTTCSSLN